MSLIKQKYLNARVKIREKLNPVFAKRRRKKLNSLDFTIISNNCWGGHVYRYFGLPYNSPTIGLYFYSPDYVKFCSNIEFYIKCNLDFITYEESKYKDDLVKHGHTKCPIGILDRDIEIIFLHYKSVSEAKEKWERRCKRINYDNLIYKLSFQNLCDNNCLLKFDSLTEDRKIAFVTKDYGLRSQVIWKGEHDGEVIPIDTIDFRRFVNLYDLVNGKLRTTKNEK